MIPKLVDGAPDSALYSSFCTELRLRGFEGELTQAAGERVVMGTDNSIYQVVPSAVGFPRNIDDLTRIATLLAEPRFSDIRIAPRGGGTGTNGQSLTGGLAVDLSRHMNRIISIDPDARRVRVEAGVVKDQLNAALRPHGLFFAPELSTSNRATIGGMISTDASGQGSCLYGKTRDHVLGLRVVLADGSLLDSVPLGAAGLKRAKSLPGLAGAVHRAVDAIHAENAALIADRFPKLNRCLTGYDLAHLRRDDGAFDLNAVICGSEGTLGFIAEAELNVMPIPACAALVNLSYGSFDAALRDAPALMALGAASIETVDSRILSLARGDTVWHAVAPFFPDHADQPAQGVNLIEFVADTQNEIVEKLAAVETFLSTGAGRSGRLGHTVAREAADIGAIWDMRKKSVGLLGNMQGEKRPVAFVEDVAVPPAQLADFIAAFRAILDRRGLDYGMFGHVDAGVLHVRPAIDMKADGAEAMIREITEAVVALTMQHGGLLWGEHGKGIRSEFSPEFFGPLYPAIQAVKKAFDPRNQFNPGKVAAPDQAGLLRIDGVPTKGKFDRQIPAGIRNAYDNALHCNGNGTCFNWDPDEAMCPSWKGTRERRHSPKGRAQLLREWLRRLSAEGADPLVEAGSMREGRHQWRHLPARFLATARDRDDFSHEVREAMDGCLGCKSCSGTCPVKVDVPAFKSKFLELYHGRYLRPLRHHVIARMEHFAPLMALVPRLANLVTRTPFTRPIGLVHAPRLSTIRLKSELRRRGIGIAYPQAIAALDRSERERSVVIVADAFISFYETHLLLDALDLLGRLGFRPWLAPFRPNGKPLHVYGFLGAFGRIARENATLLHAIADNGVPLVGLDPAMTLTYRCEYREALKGSPVPDVRLLQEWLADHLPANLEKLLGPVRAETVHLLPHCTERALAPQAIAAWKRLFGAFGIKLDVPASGCCGMAGTFGHEAEHRDLSERIYGQSWARHVRNPALRDRLVADGYSCRSQAHLIDGARLPHPLELLLTMLPPHPR